MLGVRESVCDQFRHVDGTAATVALSARIVWSVSERLVRAVERTQRASGAESHLLWPFSCHHGTQVMKLSDSLQHAQHHSLHNGTQVVQLLLVASRFLQQNVDASLVREIFELRLSEQRLQ